jgi:hypothetical protein
MEQIMSIVSRILNRNDVDVGVVGSAKIVDGDKYDEGMLRAELAFKNKNMSKKLSSAAFVLWQWQRICRNLLWMVQLTLWLSFLFATETGLAYYVSSMFFYGFIILEPLNALAIMGTVKHRSNIYRCLDSWIREVVVYLMLVLVGIAFMASSADRQNSKYWSSSSQASFVMLYLAMMLFFFADTIISIKNCIPNHVYSRGLFGYMWLIQLARKYPNLCPISAIYWINKHKTDGTDDNDVVNGFMEGDSHDNMNLFEIDEGNPSSNPFIVEFSDQLGNYEDGQFDTSSELKIKAEDFEQPPVKQEPVDDSHQDESINNHNNQSLISTTPQQQQQQQQQYQSQQASSSSSSLSYYPFSGFMQPVDNSTF